MQQFFILLKQSTRRIFIKNQLLLFSISQSMLFLFFHTTLLYFFFIASTKTLEKNTQSCNKNPSSTITTEYLLTLHLSVLHFSTTLLYIPHFRENFLQLLKNNKKNNYIGYYEILFFEYKY